MRGLEVSVNMPCGRQRLRLRAGINLMKFTATNMNRRLTTTLPMCSPLATGTPSNTPTTNENGLYFPCLQIPCHPKDGLYDYDHPSGMATECQLTQAISVSTRAGQNYQEKMQPQVQLSPFKTAFNSTSHFRYRQQEYGDPKRPIEVDVAAMSVMSSSAPTSPNSSDAEDLIPPRLHHGSSALTVGVRRGLIKHIGLSKKRRYRGLVTNCSPFFGPSHRSGIYSPHQSDVSQSAPSSPTMDTYETLPLLENAIHPHGMISEELGISGPRGWPSTFRADFISGTFLQGPTTSLFSFDCGSNRDAPYEHKLRKLELFPLMSNTVRRNSAEYVWPCLIQHGVVDLPSLSQLTRDDLIRMGVTDAETRATLMTAGQLLTSNWLTTPSLQMPPLPAIPVRPIALDRTENLIDPAHLTEKQALHDSGCSSSNEFNGPTSQQPFMDGPFQNCAQLRGADRFWSTSTTGYTSVPNTTLKETRLSHLCTEPRSQISMKPCCNPPVMPTRTPSVLQGLTARFHTLHRRHDSALCLTDTTKTVFEFQSPAPKVGLMGNLASSKKIPVGILRNASGGGPDSKRSTHPERRSSSAAPKTVKIDERSLYTSKQQGTCVGPPTPSGFFTPSNHSTGPEGQQLACQQQMTCDSSICNRTNIPEPPLSLWRILRLKLQSEGIDLTKKPYSNEIGRADIPLRLTQRYASELGLEWTTVAMALEAEREAQLREAGRPVISFIDDIQSQRYLNCDGIKTGTVEDFLISLGLPMYIDRIKQLPLNSQPSLDPSVRSPSGHPIGPVDILKMSDQDLIKHLGFTWNHIRWLRIEAAMIPSIMRAQASFGTTHMKPSGSHVNSLAREFKTMYKQSSKTRKHITNHEPHYNYHQHQHYSLQRRQSQREKQQKQEEPAGNTNIDRPRDKF
ncbi:hypothetical protein PHET_03565 [Paragonimus heterotremus]|uniref:SASH1/NUB1 homeodomain-like domain-containing protein n=1 Tax=Paragonimus heterotremus TaxID=100268 RepID=A0A8J4WIE9_9TREM|nr:hypothetical protein PHET_03565 [Paragonimus heterotremus]